MVDKNEKAPVPQEEKSLEVVKFDAPFMGREEFKIGESGIQFPAANRADDTTVERIWIKDAAICILMRSKAIEFKGQTLVLIRLPGATTLRVDPVPTELPAECGRDWSENDNVKHKKFIPVKPPEPDKTPEPVAVK